jgi:hypothetical protein
MVHPPGARFLAWSRTLCSRHKVTAAWPRGPHSWEAAHITSSYIVALNAQFLAQLGNTEFENIPNRPELRGSLRASLSA